MARQDRRTKGGNAWGKPNVTYPAADATTPEIVETATVNQAKPLKAFGGAHPDTTKYPNAKLVDQVSEPGDNTDKNIEETYHTLPGTPLVGTQTSEWAQVTTTKRPVETGTAAPNDGTVMDASVTPVNAVEAELVQAVYPSLPTPYLFGTEIDAETNIKVRVKTRLVANGTDGGIFAPPTTAILSASIATSTIIQLAAPMVIANGELVTIAGDSNTTPTINGQWPATFIDSTHFSIPVHVTAVAGSGFGSVRLAALFYTEIQKFNDRQSIEVTSQADTSTLAQATKIWSAYIDYPWKEVIVGLDYFADTGSDGTGIVGTFPVPTQLTWQYGHNFDAQVGIRTVRYTGKTLATITRSYSLGAPTPDAVQLIRTSSGEIIMLGESNATHQALSVGTSSTGLQTSTSQSFHIKTARIEDVLTNGFVTGSTIGTGVTLKMDESSPATFTGGATFIGSSEVTPGRLGLFLKESVQITVPTPFPA